MKKLEIRKIVETIICKNNFQFNNRNYQQIASLAKKLLFQEMLSFADYWSDEFRTNKTKARKKLISTITNQIAEV